MQDENQWNLTDKICPECNHPYHYNAGEEQYWCFYCRHDYVPVQRRYRFPNIEVSPDQAYTRQLERMKVA